MKKITLSFIVCTTKDTFVTSYVDVRMYRGIDIIKYKYVEVM